MTPRFPIQDAPDPTTKQVMEDTLGKMHHGGPPFQWVEDDGSSLIGCYAPLRYAKFPCKTACGVEVEIADCV